MTTDTQTAKVDAERTATVEEIAEAPETETPRVVVLGTGVAGLTAAFEYGRQRERDHMTTTKETLPPVRLGEAWAERLAQRLRHAHEAAGTLDTRADDWIPGAISALWSLIDEAVALANGALERDGLAERIGTRKTGREYWLEVVGPDDQPRQVAVFASLRPVQGHASGGAQITTSQTRAAIQLAPTVAGGRLRWLMQPTGAEFTARVVDDLLLSVFADDPAATSRLAPHFSLD